MNPKWYLKNEVELERESAKKNYKYALDISPKITPIYKTVNSSVACTGIQFTADVAHY